MSVGTVIGRHIEVSGNRLHLVLEDQEIFCLRSHDDVSVDPMFF